MESKCKNNQVLSQKEKMYKMSKDFIKRNKFRTKENICSIKMY